MSGQFARVMSGRLRLNRPANAARNAPCTTASAANTSTESHPGPTMSKSTLSARSGSMNGATMMNAARPNVGPARRPRGSHGAASRKSAVDANANGRAPNTRKPIVPSNVISPTVACASVSRPVAWGEVTASSRMASRPPAPVTRRPEAVPTTSSIEAHQA